MFHGEHAKLGFHGEGAKLDFHGEHAKLGFHGEHAKLGFAWRTCQVHRVLLKRSSYNCPLHIEGKCKIINVYTKYT